MHVRQARVGLRHHRAAGPRHHALDQRGHVGGAERAVDAHHVGAEGGERCGGHLGRGPQEGAPVLVEGHRDKDGQVGVLLGGEQRGLRLGEVGHRLDDEEVGPGRIGRAHLLGKELVGIVEGERAHGLQERTGRSDVGCHVACARCAGTTDGRGKDFVNRRGLAELGAVGTKGVGGDHLGACRHVRGVDLGDLLRVGQAQELGDLSCRQATSLQLRAHGTVKQQEVLARKHAREMLVTHAGRAQRLVAKGRDGCDGDAIHGRSFPFGGWCRSRPARRSSTMTRAQAAGWGGCPRWR